MLEVEARRLFSLMSMCAKNDRQLGEIVRANIKQSKEYQRLQAVDGYVYISAEGQGLRSQIKNFSLPSKFGYDKGLELIYQVKHLDEQFSDILKNSNAAAAEPISKRYSPVHILEKKNYEQVMCRLKAELESSDGYRHWCSRNDYVYCGPEALKLKNEMDSYNLNLNTIENYHKAYADMASFLSSIRSCGENILEKKIAFQKQNARLYERSFGLPKYSPNRVNNHSQSTSTEKLIRVSTILAIMLLVYFFLRSNIPSKVGSSQSSISTSNNIASSQSVPLAARNNTDAKQSAVAKAITGIGFSGSITTESQKDLYYYTAPITGTYHFIFDRSNVQNSFGFQMWDAKNKEIVNTSTYNEGATVDLEAGQTYQIQISQRSGFLGYNITIGIPHPPQTINGTAFGGSIKYTDQSDRFIYTAPVSGRYRFDFDRSNVQNSFGFLMVDSKNKELANTSTYNEGKTVDLDAGQTYYIQVDQRSGLLDYTITIGVPLPAQVINGNSIIGSIRYTDQSDRFTYTAPKTGEYIFNFGVSDDSKRFVFNMWDAKNKELARTPSDYDKKTINLEAGQTYRIEIQQRTGTLFNYTVKLLLP